MSAYLRSASSRKQTSPLVLDSSCWPANRIFFHAKNSGKSAEPSPASEVTDKPPSMSARRQLLSRSAAPIGTLLFPRATPARRTKSGFRRFYVYLRSQLCRWIRRTQPEPHGASGLLDVRPMRLIASPSPVGLDRLLMASPPPSSTRRGPFTVHCSSAA
ncbi:hypothetical protein MA16_Dca015275 [Dendrobium catenatum]|uniref:Uncharacterized protein n=1 Tax=Dendrobium catenatum TaxID=906689 RepID=A0A2I0X003_9ASPA|nr:hypothetical protein MA16_Dca015275 [Dendrobium catenatum]